MTDVGADASFSHQDAALLHAAGVKAIGRYFGPADPAKCLTAIELETLLARGISVFGVHERAASQWRGGAPAGTQHGAETRAWVRKTLGSLWPDERPIYAPYDESVGIADHDTFIGYQTGFNQGQNVPAFGAAYGDGYVLRILTELNLIGFKWLSDSTAFAESAQYARSGAASIVQYYGRTLPGLSGIDVDDILVTDFGQVPAPQIVVPPKQQRTKDVLSFFRITDAPAAAKVSPSTVWMSNGQNRRALLDEADLATWQFIALTDGYTEAMVQVGILPWVRASRLPVVK